MEFDRLVRPFRILANRLLPRKVLSDFNWTNYTSFDYEPQITSLELDGYGLLLNDLQIENFKNTNENISDVHAPHILLYKTCLGLTPKSVFEVGAGAGYHLINLSRLLPGVDVSGIDLLATQVSLGVKLFPEHKALLNEISFGDFTDKATLLKLKSNPEIVFTQAVTMHLPYKKAKHMLTNMIQFSSRYVILVENIVDTHDYNDLLKDVSRESAKFEYTISEIPNNKNGLILIKKLL